MDINVIICTIILTYPDSSKLGAEYIFNDKLDLFVRKSDRGYGFTDILKKEVPYKYPYLFSISEKLIDSKEYYLLTL